MKTKLLPPWEMTKKEYTDLIMQFHNNPHRFENEQYLFLFKNYFLTGLINHEEWVKEALIKGINVPETVLKDYPHLKNIEKPLIIIWCDYKDFPPNVSLSFWMDEISRKQHAFINIIREILEKAYEKMPDTIFSRIHIYLKKDILQFYPFELSFPKEFEPEMITIKKAVNYLIPELKKAEEEAIKMLEKKLGLDPIEMLEKIFKEDKKQ